MESVFERSRTTSCGEQIGWLDAMCYTDPCYCLARTLYLKLFHEPPTRRGCELNSGSSHRSSTYPLPCKAQSAAKVAWRAALRPGASSQATHACAVYRVVLIMPALRRFHPTHRARLRYGRDSCKMFPCVLVVLVYKLPHCILERSVLHLIVPSVFELLMFQ